MDQEEKANFEYLAAACHLPEDHGHPKQIEQLGNN
jgi:hypothetical protein